MGKLVAVSTLSGFESLVTNHLVDNHAIYFILGTGQIYTHGVYINGSVYGNESSGSVYLTVGSTTKQLALSSHTHDSYYAKSLDLDITTHKIKSQNTDLLYYSGGVVTLGGLASENNLADVNILAATLTTTRNSLNYTILDTGNFSITNYIDQIYRDNLIDILYGGKSFKLNFVKRTNSTLGFSGLTLTLAGSVTESSKTYGFITLSDDAAISLNRKYALIRINTGSSGELEIRTSSDSTWKAIKNYSVFGKSGTTHSTGLVPDPGDVAGTSKFLCEDGEWKAPTFTPPTAYGIEFRSNDNTALVSYAPYSAAKVIKAGSNVTISLDQNNYIIIDSLNTWIAFSAATDSEHSGTAGYITPPAYDDRIKFFRGDNSWQSIAENVTSALYVGAGNGTSNSLQANGEVHLIFAEGSAYTRYNITGSGRATVTSDASGNITINSAGYSNFGAATALEAGIAGLVPAPGTTELGADGYFLRADGTWVIPTNTWQPATTTQAGYVPYLAATGTTIASTDVAYVLVYKSGIQDTTTPVWMQLPLTAYSNDNTTAVKLGTAGATNITNGSIISTSSGIIFEGDTGQFKVGDGANSITVSLGLSTKNLTINGTTYALYTSANSLPSIYAPTSVDTGFLKCTVGNNNEISWSWDNTDYLPLTGGNVTGNINFRGTHDLSESDNDITETKYYSTFCVLDKENRIATRLENLVYLDGRNGFYLYARQYNSTGDLFVLRGIKYLIDKNNVGSWEVNDAPAFRTAIGINLDNLVTVDTEQAISAAKQFNGGITPIASGNITTASNGYKLWIKRATASTDGTPNNGLVLEYGGNTTLTGLLYMADNGQQGLYWGGWYNGVRQEWQKIAFTSNLSNYLPLTGGTMTGGISFKYDTDTSRVYGFTMLNTSGSRIGSLYYHNVPQKWIINPVGSLEPWDDAQGKYNLIIGNNTLTYNTHSIWHAGNDGSGSGLDADMLDGYDSTYFVNYGTTWDKTVRQGGYILELRVGTESTSDNPFSIIGGNSAVVIQNLPDNANWGALLAFGFSSARLIWRSRTGSQTMSDWSGVIAGSADKLVTNRKIWGLDFDGSADINGTFYFTNGDATMKIYGVESEQASYGDERVAIQTSFDNQDPLTSTYPTTYPQRAALLLQPRGGYVGIGTTSPSCELHVNGTTNTTALRVNGYDINPLKLYFKLELEISGSAENTGKWMLIGQQTISGSWNNRSIIMSIASRHSGNGIISIYYGFDKNSSSNYYTVDNCYCQINYWGTTLSLASDIIRCYVKPNADSNPTSATFYFFMYLYDYTEPTISVLLYRPSTLSTFTLATSNTIVSDIDTSTYGSLKASTLVNYVETSSNFVDSIGISSLQLTWSKAGVALTAIDIDAKTLLGTTIANWNGIPTIGNDGVMEIGRYIDFHYNSTDTRDYTVRLQVSNSSGTYSLTLPSKNGTIALTSDLSPKTATASSVTSLDISKDVIYATISTSLTLGLSGTLTTGKALTVVIYNSGSSSINITVPSSWKSLDGTTIAIGGTKYAEVSIMCYTSSTYLVSSKVQ